MEAAAAAVATGSTRGEDMETNGLLGIPSRCSRQSNQIRRPLPYCRGVQRFRNCASGCAQEVVNRRSQRSFCQVRGRKNATPTLSAQSTGKVNPEAPGWTKRLRLGSTPLDRTPCPSRMSSLEKSIRQYAEAF